MTAAAAAVHCRCCCLLPLLLLCLVTPGCLVITVKPAARLPKPHSHLLTSCMILPALSRTALVLYILRRRTCSIRQHIRVSDGSRALTCSRELWGLTVAASRCPLAPLAFDRFASLLCFGFLPEPPPALLLGMLIQLYTNKCAGCCYQYIKSCHRRWAAAAATRWRRREK